MVRTALLMRDAHFHGAHMNGLTQRAQIFDGFKASGNVLESRSLIHDTQSASQAELAEARRLWRAIHAPGLRATERLVAYARWRAMSSRMNHG
jgi:hypothetical protein